MKYVCNKCYHSNNYKEMQLASFMNQTTFLGGGAYRLEIISLSEGALIIYS